MDNPAVYPARLEIDYPQQLDRMTSFFRMLWIIPMATIVVLISGSGETVYYTVGVNQAAEVINITSGTIGGLAAGLTVATALMIICRQRYPRWWFDFSRELTRFQARVGAYAVLLPDLYPSTVDEQSVHLDSDYPDVENDLNRWLPLIKCCLAIPHYVVLIFLTSMALFAVAFSWFGILITGQHPCIFFDFVVGVARWWLRVNAYAFLMMDSRIYNGLGFNTSGTW